MLKNNEMNLNNESNYALTLKLTCKKTKAKSLEADIEKLINKEYQKNKTHETH